MTNINFLQDVPTEDLVRELATRPNTTVFGVPFKDALEAIDKAGLFDKEPPKALPWVDWSAIPGWMDYVAWDKRGCLAFERPPRFAFGGWLNHHEALAPVLVPGGYHELNGADWEDSLLTRSGPIGTHPHADAIS